MGSGITPWMNIALTYGIGIASVVGGELVRHLPILLAAAVLGALVLLPAAIFIVTPAPDRQLAAESFGHFNGNGPSVLGENVTNRVYARDRAKAGFISASANAR